MQDNPFHQSFSHRLAALKALERCDADAIQAAAIEISNVSSKYGRIHPSSELRAFSDTLDCLTLVQRWKNAVRDADADAVRFRDASRQRATEALERRADDEPCTLDFVLEDIVKIDTPNALADLKHRVLHTALPFGVRTDERGILIPAGDAQENPPQLPEVAFVKFEINGQPAKEIDTLNPNRIYDIGIDIRVSRWPEFADRLIVTPVSMEPADTYDLPTFVIDRPTATGNDSSRAYEFQKNGRLRIKVAAAFGARPFEFKYRAVFEPSRSEQPLDIIGHRTLRFQSVDPLDHAISGYAEIDRKLLELRDKLGTVPGLPDIDRCNALEVCAGLGNLAGQALSDSLFPEGTKEDEFQTEAVKALRLRPSIGEDLEIHPQTGGGVTDLSFHRIRIELKAVTRGEIGEAEIGKFVNQTAQYVVSSGKRIGVLCVLDSRKKNMPPPPAESHIRIIDKQIGNTYVQIVFLCVEGGLARPSDLSR